VTTRIVDSSPKVKITVWEKYYIISASESWIFLFWCHHCPWVTTTSTKSKPIHLNPQSNIKVSILINSTFFVSLLSYVLEYRNNIVVISWVQYRIMTWGYCVTVKTGVMILQDNYILKYIK